MSNSGQKPKQEIQQETENPAIGLVITEENHSAIAHSVIRATENGYHVLATYTNKNIEAIDFADQLGAEIITPVVDEPETVDLQQILVSAAQVLSHSGLIIHDGHGEIDFAQSEKMLTESDDYVDAVTKGKTTAKNESSIEILVAIPAYDEGRSIADVVTDSKKHADSVLVVDDGSTDDTTTLAREAGAEVVEHETNSGYGAALKTTFEEAHRRDVEHLVILDGDGQHDASDIPKLVAKQLDTDADIVIGSRFENDSETKMPIYRRFGLGVVNGMTNLSMGVIRKESWVQDTQSGFRAYNEQAIGSLASDLSIGDHMNASTDILYHAHQHDYKIEEIGTTISYDVEDASSHNPVSHGFVLVSNILKTVERDRPITSLGLPGFISSFAGLGFGYWTFSNYISTGVFPMGLAITSAFFGLAGIFACFTAIILHSLNTQLSSYQIP